LVGAKSRLPAGILYKQPAQVIVSFVAGKNVISANEYGKQELSF
jgi:hypothetical protein